MRGAYVGVGSGVVVAVTVDGVSDLFSDLVGGFVETLTEGVVLSFFVVISHITLELLGGGGCSGRRFYSNLFSGEVRVDDVNLTPLRRIRVVLGGVRLLGVGGGLLVVGEGGEVGGRVTLHSS